MKAHRVLQVQGTCDIVNVSFVDRKTGIRRVRHKADGVVQPRASLNRRNLRPVGHDILSLLVVKLKDILDHLRLVLIQDALFMSLIDHGQDLVFCDGVLQAGCIYAENPCQQKSCQIQGGCKRTAQSHQKSCKGQESLCERLLPSAGQKIREYSAQDIEQRRQYSRSSRCPDSSPEKSRNQDGRKHRRQNLPEPERIPDFLRIFLQSRNLCRGFPLRPFLFLQFTVLHVFAGSTESLQHKDSCSKHKESDPYQRVRTVHICLSIPFHILRPAGCRSGALISARGCAAKNWFRPHTHRQIYQLSAGSSTARPKMQNAAFRAPAGKLQSGSQT